MILPTPVYTEFDAGISSQICSEIADGIEQSNPGHLAAKRRLAIKRMAAQRRMAIQRIAGMLLSCFQPEPALLCRSQKHENQR